MVLVLGPRMPYLGAFRPEFGKVTVTYEISPFEFVKMQSIVDKNFKFDTKIYLFECFRLGFEQ